MVVCDSSDDNGALVHGSLVASKHGNEGESSLVREQSRRVATHGEVVGIGAFEGSLV